MWCLKACPRCRGDLYVKKGDDGSHQAECLLCGQELAVRLRALPVAAEIVQREPVGVANTAA